MDEARQVAAVAEGKVREGTLGAVVLRAVPCEAHAAYTLGCPDCLTGEEAFRQGVAQRQDDLGTIASTHWNGWRRFLHPFARWSSRRRIHRANKRAGF
jgi:hypothetical protein